MLDFLSNQLKNEVLRCFCSPYEVRLRVDKPVTVKGSNGIEVLTKKLNFTVTKKELEQTVMRLCNHSLFSVEDSLKYGFITSRSGERVGICGETIYSGGSIASIKNFSSLTIRFPHCVYGCCEEYAKSLGAPKSCLVISPPFHGKTTFIRDLGRYYSDKFKQNVLFIDERDELSLSGKFNLGENSDVLRFSNKRFGFYNGVRAYNPDVIICDELMTSEDSRSVEFARNSGVKVVASAHASNLKNLLKKQELYAIIANNTFEDIVLLNKFKIEKIYKEQDWLSLL